MNALLREMLNYSSQMRWHDLEKVRNIMGCRNMSVLTVTSITLWNAIEFDNFLKCSLPCRPCARTWDGPWRGNGPLQPCLQPAQDLSPLLFQPQPWHKVLLHTTDGPQPQRGRDRQLTSRATIANATTMRAVRAHLVVITTDIDTNVIGRAPQRQNQ
jgi:hypothetical protein